MHHDRDTSSPPRTRSRLSRSAARGLGWFSIGLGVAELLAPRAVARVTGMRGREAMVRAAGVREILTGIGLLAARRPGPWMWVRVAGDAVDAATLGWRGRPRLGARRAMAAVAGLAALDAGCAAAVERIERRGRVLSRDLADRRGMPLPAQAMRGTARKDFEVPADMATPPLLAPWQSGELRS